ncbi:MAG: transglutaminase domain-containing protein, partial [Ruminococcus sp.]|nr:transglutaminase domain-containing protein [Ruminococcus sp.]
KFVPINIDYVASSLAPPLRAVFCSSAVSDENWSKAIADMCKKYSLYTYDDYFPIDLEIPTDQSLMYMNGQYLAAELLEDRYREFVYDNYLQIPENKNMDEVRAAYSDILAQASNARTAEEKVALLDEIRKRMAADCKYTLSPGKTPSNRDFVNYFLIENKKGYCIHYATSGVMLARMAGIPARYATGYIVVADDFSSENMNPDGSYTIDVQDNRSHAWAEIYLDGYGWIPFEFTDGYTSRPVGNAPAPPEPGPDPPRPTEPDPALATTTSPQSLTTAANSGATTTTAALTGNSAAKSGTGNPGAGSKSDKHSGFKFPLWLKTVITILLIVGTAVGFIILRRKYITNKRRECFNSGTGSNRVGHMYLYAEKLLDTLQLKNDNSSYTGFAEDVERHIGGSFIEKGSFEKFMEIALRSGFSGVQPSKEEIESCKKLVDQLSGSIYEKSGFFRRLWLKLINALV